MAQRAEFSTIAIICRKKKIFQRELFPKFQQASGTLVHLLNSCCAATIGFQVILVGAKND